MSSTLRFAANVLVAGAVLSIVLTFVASRAVIFSEQYNGALNDNTKHAYNREHCDGHSDFSRLNGEWCEQAKRAAQREPWKHAFAETLARTHSCGQWPCSMLYGVLLEKTNSVLFNVILALGLLLLVYVLATRVLGSMVHTAQGKHYIGTHEMVYNAPSQIEGGPSMLRYDNMAAPLPLRYYNGGGGNDNDGSIRLLGVSSRRAYDASHSD